jgi:hypothetical protein
VATNLAGGRHFPTLELTCDNGEISGRFDPNTEYRFAFIRGGAFRSDRLRLEIDYINDHYTLEGTLERGRLRGSWRLLGGEEHGTWEATRSTDDPPITRLPTGTIPLYEWRRAGEPAPRYTTGQAPGPPGWTRLPDPLCRVWPPIR